MPDNEPKVFISAVSGEFESARNAVGADLRARDCAVTIQSDFKQGPDSVTLLKSLYDYIRDCSAVVCLIGKRTGAYPPLVATERFKDLLPPGMTEASYTQWEYLFARHFKRRTYVYVANDDWTPDKPGAPDNKQTAFVQYLKDEGTHRTPFSTIDQLGRAVLKEEFSSETAQSSWPPRQQAKPIVLPYPSLGHLFKGREDFMEKLDARLGSPDGKTVVIGKPEAFYGLGGIGKTRAAVEYAWAHQDDYSALLFIVAETPEALRANLVALTRVLVPEADTADDNVRLQAVLGWLRANPGWLLILDNVDSRPALTAVEGLLQELQGGQVLVTSRLSDFSGNFAPLPLDVLSLDDAVAFLLARTEGRRRNAADDQARAREIATEVDGLALALEQAAAYIAKRRLTFGVYLEQWRAADHSKMLDWFDETVTGYKRAIAVTWQTSVAQLTDPGRRLLERLAWFAPEPVPEFLLDVPVRDGKDESPHEALDDLAAYSLVTRNVERPFFFVHRLVQDVTRRSLTKERQQEGLKEALEWIATAFPDEANDVSAWPRAVPLASHARAIAHEADKAAISEPTAELMNQLGTLLHSKAVYAEAEPLFRRSLAIREIALGESHPEVGSSLNYLGMLYRAQGRYAEAEPLYRRSLAIREMALGESHLDVGVSLNNLGLLYRVQGRDAEAEPLIERALAIVEKALGAEHPNVAAVLSNLGELYRQQGRLADAEPLFQRSLAIRETAFGPDHPDVAIPLNNLAGLYRAQGRYPDAEPLYQRALIIREGALGPEHPSVGTALNNLAGIYELLGRHAEAEPLHQRDLAISEKALGPNHPDIGISLNNLAELYRTQGRNAEASPLYRRCIRIFIGMSNQVGRPHPNLEAAISNYARFLAGTGKSEAEIKSRIEKLRRGED